MKKLVKTLIVFGIIGSIWFLVVFTIVVIQLNNQDNSIVQYKDWPIKEIYFRSPESFDIVLIKAKNYCYLINRCPNRDFKWIYADYVKKPFYRHYWIENEIKNPTDTLFLPLNFKFKY